MTGQNAVCDQCDLSRFEEVDGLVCGEKTLRGPLEGGYTNAARLNRIGDGTWHITIGNDLFDGSDVAYCPWCGRELDD